MDISNQLTAALPPDIFGREGIADAMCELIKSLPIDECFPISLDAAWGTGKTVHALRMKKIFENKHKHTSKCIYWNASKSDYSNEPLLTLIAELYQYVSETNKPTYTEKGFKLCKKNYIKGIARILNQITEHTLGVDVENVVSTVNEPTSNIDNQPSLAKQFEDYLKQTEKAHERIQAAKDLIELVRENKELIIIIDELDRCRPTYALTLLENIKYLFEESNCKFVLVLNSESIISSIKHIYGLNEDAATRYLNKYIQTNLILPTTPTRWDGINDCNGQYFYYLLHSAGFENCHLNDFMAFFTSFLFKKKKLELREVNKLVKKIKQLMYATKKYIHISTRGTSFFVVCFVAYIVEFMPYVVQKLYTKDINAEDVLDELSLNAISHNEQLRKVTVLIETLIKYHIMSYESRSNYIESMPDSIRYEIFSLWDLFTKILNTSIYIK